MLLKINGIGKQKIKYKDHTNLEFDTLSNYLLLAKKAISKFANKTFNGLGKKMLNDEDAISSVANAIMMADWRWDENYINQQGTKKTKYSYRNQCALWAIQTYASKIYQKPKKIKNIYSLDHKNEEMDLSNHDLIEDTNCDTPEEHAINKEYCDSITSLIDSIFTIDYLTDRQKDYIKLYYFEDYTFDKIGKKYGVTREAVRQGLNKAIEMIKETINV